MKLKLKRGGGAGIVEQLKEGMPKYVEVAIALLLERLKLKAHRIMRMQVPPIGPSCHFHLANVLAKLEL